MLFYKALIFNRLKADLARVRSISGKTIFQDVPKNFSKKFWRMKKRFYNAVYSKAKQQRPTSTEKTNKKQVNQNRKKKQTNQSARARNKELFCGKPIFVARTNENSPVRFGTIKEGVK